MIFSLFKKAPQEDAATSLYRTAMDQSRLPDFYADWMVPDSLDGRFEMVTLHVYLLMRLIKENKDIDPETRKTMGQKLFDAMFLNLDDTLREMGVGDLSVSKKIRKMAEAFYGHIGAYEAAFLMMEDDQEKGTRLLNEALQKNVYGLGGDLSDQNAPISLDASLSSSLPLLVNYTKTCFAALQSQPVGRILKGIVYFPAPNSPASNSPASPPLAGEPSS